MITNRSAPHARVTPVLIVADVRAAVAWFSDVFGFVEHVRIGEGHRSQLGLPDGEPSELVVAEVRPGRRTPQGGRSHQTMLKVANVTRVVEAATARGAVLVDPPHDWEYGERQAAIDDLQGQLSRWNDPAYVTAQARERLGWLVPGETGYTVVGADGKPLGGGLTLDSSATVDPEQAQPMWWDRMWGSVAAADKPAPVKTNPGNRPPVTADSKPR